MRNLKYRGFLIVVGVTVLIAGGFSVLNSYIYNEKQAVTKGDYRDTEFVINGERVALGGEARYFGGDFITDVNDDGRDDVVFIITHEPGGSGTFYYAVAALNTEDGYLGSDGYLLGDRIAPQTIEMSQNPRHVNVVVVNYADRREGESMTTQPAVGKSAYLKLDPVAMQWGIVEPDFAGEGETLPPAGGVVTVRGEMVCLPKRTTGPQTLECAIGLKGNDGKHYVLKNLFEHDPTYALSQTGVTMEVSGTISYEGMHGPDGNPYDIIGVITITSLRKL